MKKENSQIRLRQLMKEQNLRQVDILEKSKPFQAKLGITMSKTHLSNYVNGKSNPDQKKLMLLSQTLGVSEPWLMGYNVPKNENKVTISIIDKTVETMKQLEAARQEVVLTTATEQLEEQESENVIDIRLTDKWLTEQVNGAVADDGIPLTPEQKEFYKKLLKQTMQEKIDRGE